MIMHARAAFSSGFDIMHKIRKQSRKLVFPISTGTLIASLALAVACTQAPEWKARSDKLVRAKNLATRIRTDIPRSRVVPNLQAGSVTNFNELPVTEIAPGVKAKVYWGKGVLVAWSILEPGAEIAHETLPSERLMIVMHGSIRQLIGENTVTMEAVPRAEPDGIHGTMPGNEFLYLTKGAPSAVKAGDSGAEMIEIYSPPRLDYMAKAGAESLPPSLPEAEYALEPTVKPGRVYDLYDLPLTNLVPGSNSRLVGTHSFQASFLRMDPGATFALHIHPEEQLMTALRGTIDELILDGSYRMAKGNIVLLPGDMVHGGNLGETGCDAIDIFWPARPDYDARRVAQCSAFEEVIPAGSKPEIFIDGTEQGPGIGFAEGPKWLGGRLYLSSMFFDQNWTGDPKRSSIVEVRENGTYRYISHGLMQTSGLMPLENGNLAVCDMFGHRVIEMTTTGRLVRTLASTYGGNPIGSAKDIVADAKGGIYFTDPQFTPEPKTSRPGPSVYYLNPKGGLIRVIGQDALALPNGITLSPDGKTLFVDSKDKDEWVWAFEVKDDGTVAGSHRFAKLFLPPEVLDSRGRSSGAGGMAVNERGDLFVATYCGLQVFNARGEFLGIVNTPVVPVSCCFGGSDMRTLFIVGYDKVFRIRTQVAGLKYGPK
jgi:gluconolactonase